jgi:hypothetical protein
MGGFSRQQAEVRGQRAEVRGQEERRRNFGIRIY